jgi:preprotein translocase subunit YajC
MVEFVLDGAPEQAFGFEVRGTSLEVGCADPHTRRAADIGEQPGKAQAPLGVGVGISGGFDCGIDQHHRHVGGRIRGVSSDPHAAGPLRRPGDVHHKKLNRHGHLLGGKPDPLCGGHGLDHVGGQFAHRRVHRLNPAAFGPQGRMPVGHNLESHALFIAPEGLCGKSEERGYCIRRPVGYSARPMINPESLVLSFAAFLAEGAPAPQQQPNLLMQMFPLILIFVLFYFVLIRPQQKRQKEHQKLVDALKTGDRVVTSAGIHGMIANVKDATIVVKVAENVKVEFDRSAVVKVEKSADTLPNQ